MTHRQLQDMSFLCSKDIFFARPQSLRLEDIACPPIPREHCRVEGEPEIYPQIVVKDSAFAPYPRPIRLHTTGLPIERHQLRTHRPKVMREVILAG